MNIQEAEQALTNVVVQSWDRIRSSEELQTLIGRRELALQSMVDSSEFEDLL